MKDGGAPALVSRRISCNEYQSFLFSKPLECRGGAAAEGLQPYPGSGACCANNALTQSMKTLSLRLIWWFDGYAIRSGIRRAASACSRAM